MRTISKDPKPWQLVNRAFSGMMFGNGAAFQYLGENDTHDQMLVKVAANLESLNEYLRIIAESMTDLKALQRRHHEMVSGIAILFDDVRQLQKQEQQK